jgi:hypothetical protein
MRVIGIGQRYGFNLACDLSKLLPAVAAELVDGACLRQSALTVATKQRRVSPHRPHPVEVTQLEIIGTGGPVIDSPAIRRAIGRTKRVSGSARRLAVDHALRR